MRLSSPLHDDTVTILTTTHGAPDADGVPTEVTTETAWEGVNVQQVRADEEDTASREATVTRYRVSGPIPPVEVREEDEIRWRGVTHTIDGEPDTRRGAMRVEHTSLVMVRARG